MKYFIPTNITTKDKEWRRILRSVEGYEAQNVDMTIRFIYEHWSSYNPDASYQELFELYKKIGIATDDDNINTFFTEKRDATAYKGELQLLWRTLLLLSTKDRSWNIKETYDKWKKDFALPPDNRKYVNKIMDLCSKSLQENQTDIENDKNGVVQEKSTLPLVDKNSPYYEYVSGTVYEEMYNLYTSIKDNMNYTLKAPSLVNDDMEQLLYKIQLHYIRRNNQGSYIPMTQAEREELIELHEECIKSLTRINADNNIYRHCSNLTALLVRNRNNLKFLATNKLPPLASVMRSNLKPTIELTERSQSKIGANMSSREAVEYTDEYGVLHRGFFTENVYETSKEADVTAAIKEFKLKYPAYDKELDIIFPDKKAPNRMANINMLFEIRDYLNKENVDQATKLYKEFINNTKWSSDQIKEDAKFGEMITQLIFQIIPPRKVNQHAVLKASGITEGDELASRASAMSDVALALGFPELLIESRNVTVKIGDKTIDGVMMEGAAPDMRDPSHITLNDPFFSKKIHEQMDSPEILSSFANLQILDFLCGNTDRHMGNFFWKQDLSDPENPKLLGIQGIDNDTSFGAITDGGKMKLAYHDNLKIITPEMAAAVEKLSKYNLYMILKPYSLSKEQEEAAEARLELLQKLIKNGRNNTNMKFDKEGRLINDDMSIHIVKPEEWQKLNANKLVPIGKEKRTLKDNTTIDNINIFSLLDIYNTAFTKPVYKRLLFGNNKANKPIKYNKQKPKEEVILPKSAAPIPDYEALLTYHKEESERLIRIKHTLFINGGNALNKRSEEFKEMYQALDNYIIRYTKLKHILREDTRGDAKKANLTKEMRLAMCYKDMSADREILNSKIVNYLNRPRHVWGNTQNRINSARDLKDFLSSEKESQKIYDNYTKEKLEYIEKNSYTPGEDLKKANNALNQILAAMKFTLMDNINTAPPGHIIHEKGVKVAVSLERLWNYSMNSVNNSFISVKTPKIKEGMSDEQHAKELSSLNKVQNDIVSPDLADKKIDEPVMKQIIEDLKNILAYEEALDKTNVIRKIVDNKNSNAQKYLEKLFKRYENDKKAMKVLTERRNKPEAKEDPKAFTNSLKALIDANANGVTITPAQVCNVLHNLYSRELEIANIGKMTAKDLAKKNNKPNKDPNIKKNDNIRKN